MAAPRVPPTGDAIIVDILKRLEVLENDRERLRRGRVRERAIFSLHGPLYATLSGKHRVEEGGPIIAAVCDLNKVGTTDTVFQIHKNGAPLGPRLTVLAGQLYGSAYLGNATVAADVDHLQVELVTPGTGAETAVVQIRTRT